MDEAGDFSAVSVKTGKRGELSKYGFEPQVDYLNHMDSNCHKIQTIQSGIETKEKEMLSSE